MHSHRLFFSSAIALACSTAQQATAQDGQLQTSFGTGGHVLTGLAQGTFDRRDAGNAVVEQADGKILAGNTYAHGGFLTHRRWAMMRYLPNGQPDPTFGTAGVKKVAFGDTTISVASCDLALDDSLQRIYQCGSALVENGDSARFCVVAFHMDGSVDPTFGVQGLAAVSPFGGNATPRTMVVQADGRILVGGSEGEGELVIVRLNTDGNLDDSFGTDGVFTHPGTVDNWEVVNSLLVDPVTQFIYAGVTTNQEGPGSQMQVFRLDTSGQLDPGWAGNGMCTLPFVLDAYLADMALLPDGRLLTVGSTNYDVGLCRLLQDGSMDTSFCGAGYTIIGLNAANTMCRSIAVQADCKIVLAGALGSGDPFNLTNPRAFVWRLLPTSNVDATFANASVFIDSIPEAADGHSEITGMLIHSDHRIIYCGTAKAIGGDGLDDDQFVGALTATASGECPPDVNIGVEETTVAALVLYPVPSSGMITIASELPLTRLLVRDANGRIMHSSSPKALTVHLELHTPGVYQAEVTVNGRTTTKRLVICE